jgi:hypothetical protein
MKQKSLSQMNKEKKLKPMTIEEEYRNADVPMPNDLLNSSNTEQFTKKAEEDYSGGKAYTEFLKFFYKGGNK